MMTSIARFTLLSTLAVANATAQQPAVQPGADTQMARLSWLVGAWVGTGDMPGYGPHEFRLEFEWTLNKTFLKNSHWMTVDEEVVWHDIGMIGWDSENKAFSTFNFGIDGLIGYGAGKPEKDGDDGPKTELVIHGRTTDGNKFRWHIRQLDADTMESVCYDPDKGHELTSRHVGKREKKKQAGGGKAGESKRETKREQPEAEADQRKTRSSASTSGR